MGATAEVGDRWIPLGSVPHYLLFLASRKLLHMLTTAEGIMTQTDRLNGDGLQEVFATNLFGHFMLVRLHMRTEPSH